MNKTAILITGSNRGYGEAIARHVLSLTDSTCHVVLHSRSGQIQWLENVKYEAKVTIVSGDFR